MKKCIELNIIADEGKDEGTGITLARWMWVSPAVYDFMRCAAARWGVLGIQKLEETNEILWLVGPVSQLVSECGRFFSVMMLFIILLCILCYVWCSASSFPSAPRILGYSSFLLKY